MSPASHTRPLSDPQAFVEALRADKEYSDQFKHARTLPPRQASFQDPARPLPPVLTAHLAKLGIPRLYTHQAQALDLLADGGHLTVVTPTASGKTLTYLLPVLTRLLEEPEAKALFLFPIKALAQDQLGVVEEWLDALNATSPNPSKQPPLSSPKGRGKGRTASTAFTAMIYDGDTPPYQRKKIKENPPSILITNPDMLHLGVLPSHAAWAAFFSKLRYVVVDEAHTYRGIFGAHVAMILRRLRRICAFYGSQPQMVCLSATIANPEEFTSRLIHAPVQVISASGAPASARTFILWNPMASPYREATELFARLVRSGFKTIAFAKARKITELMAMWIRQSWPDLEKRVRSYRAGYLPEERREIERQLFSGELEGVISTSALELGIDVGGLDACLLVGYPGTMISTLQRAGRVGRAGRPSLIFLIALSDALDQYFINHPDFFFDKPTEHALLPSENRVIRDAHLQAAAEEMPLEGRDEAFLGPRLKENSEALWRSGLLRLSQEGRFHAARKQVARTIHIRSLGGGFLIEQKVKGAKNRAIGRMEYPRVYRDCHPGAVYLHAGAQFKVLELDEANKTVVVEEADLDYYTEPRGEDLTEILSTTRRAVLGDVEWCFGEVQASEQVTGYVKKHIANQKILQEYELNMPVHRYQTQAAWWVLPSAWRKEFAVLGLDFAGSLHALEHAKIAMLPLFVLCDRWDLGGVSYWSQPQLDKPAIFIYDGYPGGAALAEKGFELAKEWLNSVIGLLQDCPCEDGCPSCVQSPKCGNGNKPLDKRGAMELARRLYERIKDWTPLAAGEVVKPVPETLPSASFATPVPTPPPAPGPAMSPTVKLDPALKNVVFLDVETQFLADEVGGWDKKELMKVSVAVTYNTREKQYRQYTEATVPRLLDELFAADLVVGFNTLGFDYAVLQPYGLRPLAGLPSLDLLAEIKKTLGFRLKLDSLAQATLKAEKSADGLQAVAWFREGKLEQLLSYCQKDVEITHRLWAFGREFGYLLFEDRDKGLLRVSADW